jgi:hypothetical protein
MMICLRQNEGEYGSGGFPQENGGVQPPRQSRNLQKANTFAEAKILDFDRVITLKKCQE